MSSLRIPAAVRGHARRTAASFGALTGVDVNADVLLTGRAALLGLSPRGQVSAGGASRLLRAADGWCALTLSRPDDVAAMPALLGYDRVADDPWPDVAEWTAQRNAAEVTARARLLGLPAARLGETGPGPPRIRARGRTSSVRPASQLLVADLSSMWAGPLCGRLLADAGAVVVKVESPRRPDGTRAGPVAFFDWMNSGKLSYAVDFDNRKVLHTLLSAVDVVIEGSRPAALTRRGLGPQDVTPRPGRVWLRVTGHGTDGERADWVAFGDDAAVSGGLVCWDSTGPAFCGDAVADPLTGLHAAVAVAESLSRGGGELIELSMAAVAATYAVLPPLREIPCGPAIPPPRRAQAAAVMGADNAAVERLLSERSSAAC